MSLRKSLYFQVLAAMIAGALIGHYRPEYAMAFKPLGDAFIRLISMMVGPIVFCTIVLGIAGMKEMKRVGKTVFKAMGLFYLLTAVALATGLAAVSLFRPGAGMHVDAALLDPALAARYINPNAPRGFIPFLMNIIPGSVVGAFAENNVLSVVLLACLTGLTMAQAGPIRESGLKALASLSELLFSVFGFLLKFAPAGAFGAMAFTVGKYGIQSIRPLGLLIASFYLACAFFVLVVLGAITRLHGFSVIKMLRYFREELLMVLGTSSSEPALPGMLAKLERLGCRKGVSGLVVPLGYSFNLDGSAIYLSLSTVFIAQACDIELSPARILSMLAIMLLTSKGAAGVTGSGFVALVATLSIMSDIPVAAAALIVGIDRFMSEARALTSVISNAAAGIIVSLWEGACDRAVLASELDTGRRD
jgi:Na+/H+-dicarboxylate symporter